ncbi:MAG: hypothetical protein HY899_07355 [Deltaproteobacteria bacterium]|nr:hypothetical protein [Deltaproteobacteria bacterium]
MAALQEELSLEPTDQFEFRIDLAALGLDPDLTQMLVEAGPLCFLDFEATGLDPANDELIEAGAILVEPGQRTVRVFNSFVHTTHELTPFIKRLTGISQQNVASAPPLGEVAPALDRFIGAAPVVAHNAAFEKSWLAQGISGRFGRHAFMDTVELLALVYPDSPNMKLDTFCRDKLGRGERHRALDDALDMLRVVVNVLGESRRGSPAPANAAAALLHFYPASPWRERLDGAVGFTFAEASPRAASAGAVAEDVFLAPVPFDRSAIEARLRDVEQVRRVLPGYEFRPGQLEFFGHVFDCFAGVDGKTVAIGEAGTGIGKTLAYLAVAIPFARHRGTQVVISTSSKLLQTQLLEKDIPAAARLLGYPDLRYTVMKGRANYVCRRRLDRFLTSRQRQAPSLDNDEAFASALLAAFSSSASHGEIDRIPTVLYQINPVFERCAREVTSADADECRRQTCETTGGHCVFRSARHRLEGADIAVVNHDLLLRWPPDYPPLRHLILDEAHELVDKADSAYARSAEGVELAHRLEEILGMRGSPPLADDDETQVRARRALACVAKVGEAARAVVKSEGVEQAFQFGRDELLIPPGGPGPEWKELTDAALELARDIKALALRFATGSDDADAPGARLREVLEESAAVLEHALPYPKSEMYVFRLRGLARTNAASWRFLATPVLPADDFREHVLEIAETLFATSATLAVSGEDDGAMRELCLAREAGPRYRIFPAVQSPFDYPRNLQILFLSDATDQAALVDRTARATATVARKLGGRTLGLFTSRDRMIRVADILAGRLADDGITVMTPAAGNSDPHELVRSFMDSPRAVLLGARAFWQGIDIPGEACQAVIIEKLPFDVPGDPLLQRRAEVLFGRGSRAFTDYQLPRMLLRLKQMMGRLIRTPTDYGMIVVVEPRADKPYFRRILESLPTGAAHQRVRLDELGLAVDDFLLRHK